MDVADTLAGYRSAVAGFFNAFFDGYLAIGQQRKAPDKPSSSGAYF
jgi:hypothetical protein